MRTISLMAFGCLIAAGCAAESEESGSSSSPGTGGGAADGGGACNDVINDAPTHYVTEVQGSMPAPAGGPLMLGAYHQVDEFVYTSGVPAPPADPSKTTLVLDDESTWQMATRATDDPLDFRRTFAVDISGAQTTVSTTCPTELAWRWVGYKAAGGTLTLYDASSRADVFEAHP